MSVVTMRDLFYIMASYTYRGVPIRYWWVPLLAGILSVAIGVWCFFNPVATLSALAYFFAACLCVSGLFHLFFSLANLRGSGWVSAMAIGLIEVIGGGWMFFLPENVVTGAFVFAVGIYIIVVCINSICEACMMMSYSSSWVGLLIVFLIATLVFAVIFLAGPIVGGIAVWLYIGISFICFGLYRIILAFKLKRINKRIR